MKGGFDTHSLVINRRGSSIYSTMAVLHWQGVSADRLEGAIRSALVKWCERSDEGTAFVAEYGLGVNLYVLSKHPSLNQRGSPLNIILGNEGVFDLTIDFVSPKDIPFKMDTPLIEDELFYEAKKRHKEKKQERLEKLPSVLNKLI